MMIIFWTAGKVAARCSMPGLVGEIFAGIILGPNLLAYAPKPQALMMFGEIGLLLLFLEAGLDVDVEMIKLIGPRGICLAVAASTLSLLLGMGLGLAIGLDLVASFAVGATLAPTSVGIALNVLRTCSALNTPTGQVKY
jgi:Kef-type K+ transport system membrane component KefB